MLGHLLPQILSKQSKALVDALLGLFMHTGVSENVGPPVKTQNIGWLLLIESQGPKLQPMILPAAL